MKTQLGSASGRVGSRRRRGGRLGCARDRRYRGGRRASEGGYGVGVSGRLLATCRARGRLGKQEVERGGAPACAPRRQPPSAGEEDKVPWWAGPGNRSWASPVREVSAPLFLFFLCFL